MKKRLLTAILFFLVVCSFAFELPPSDVTILENGYYFDGKAFVKFSEMSIEGGKITDIRLVPDNVVYPGTRIPLNGKYVIPGLIDAHVHISGSPAYPYVMADPVLNANSALLCGVTSMVDLFYQESRIKETRDIIDKSPAEYATVYMAGPILTAPGGHGTEYGVPTRTITSVAEARKQTSEAIDAGIDVIKLVYEDDPSHYIPSINIDMVKAIVDVAHKRGKKVFAHIDRAAQATACAEARVDILAHMPDDLLSNSQLKKIKAAGTIIIPTVTVMWTMEQGADAPYMSDTLLWSSAGPDYLSAFSHARAESPFSKEILRRYYPESKYMENLAACIKLNIPILAGTDAGNFAVFYGYSLHNEIAQYVKAGMSNAAALKAASENISLVFPTIKTGKIAEDYDADLVVLNTDPLKDISSTKDISMVFHKGMLIKNLVAEKARHDAAVTAIPYDPSVFDLNGLAQLPDYTASFSDSLMGGKSSIRGALRHDGNAAVLHLDGKVVVSGYSGFATLGFALSKKNDDLPVDISAYSGIEFDVKGNGETYYLLFASTLVKDYNFYMAPFNTGKEWNTVRVNFDKLAQSPYFGKKVPFDPKNHSNDRIQRHRKGISH